ncbi:MAG: ISKra4 family transposase [Janthinobacterium lividum]
MEWVVKLEARSGLGEVETIEVGRIKRHAVGLTAEEIGLTLEEGKGLLGELARLVLQTQMEEFATCARLCRDCLKLRRLRDSRTRKIQTLFGTITVEAPRISICPCMNDWDFVDISWSPLTELLPDRCTPELRRLQAELSARHSLREAARLLTSLLPCQPMNHATMRNRTHRVASDLEQMPPSQPAPEPKAKPQAEIMVLIDGADIRAAHGYQSRHVDVTVGKIEVAGRPPRWFALAPKGAGSPLATMRQALREQGWQPGLSVTVLSDGEAALPGLVRAAVGKPITCILDWWHISMRVQHIQQAMRGLHALDPQPCLDLDMIDWWVGRPRHLIWHDRSDEALDELFYIQHAVPVIVRVNGETFRSAAARLLWNCDDLRRYLGNAGSSLINYGERYRSKLPISTSRAEGCVDEIANARMAKKQRMRWSPQGAHRVAVVRAAVLDGRLTQAFNLPLAA